MKKDQITRTLNAMVGKRYRYKAEAHTVLRFSNENVVKITTDRKDLTFLPEDFTPDDFEEIVEVIHHDVSLQQSQEQNKYLQTPVIANAQASHSLISQQGFAIADIIKENIEKVKADPSFVPQAEAVNNAVKVFIDLAKVEVEMIKATR